MILDLHPEMRVQRLVLGNEKCPLLIVDNFIAQPERLVQKASSKVFTQPVSYYPGLRAQAPLSYQHLIETQLGPLLFEFFQLKGSAFRFAMSQYSIVTVPPERLQLLQRIPHFDSIEGNALATVHYLFKGNLGGTSFYRHRKTGFEYIDRSRRDVYFKALEAENDGPNMPAPGYISGDTPLFEQIAKQDGIFNRMLVYRRNSLHSGDISNDLVLDPNPLTGRLSINTFIDLVP